MYAGSSLAVDGQSPGLSHSYGYLSSSQSGYGFIADTPTAPRGYNCEGKFSVQMLNLFIHSGHFYSAHSNPLPLRGAPDYSTDTVSEFHAEAHRQL